MKVYKLKYHINRNEGLNALINLHLNLINSKSYDLKLNFFASNISQFIDLLRAKYLPSVRGFSFQAAQSSFKNILNKTNDKFEGIYLYSNRFNRDSENIGYSFYLKPLKNQYNFEIKLPYWHSKEINIIQAEQIISFLNSRNAISIEQENINELSSQLISNSWDNRSNNKWIFRNDLNEFSTWADVNPKINGIFQGNRPSGIAIKFEEELNENSKFKISTPMYLMNIIDEYLKTDHLIKGFFRTNRLLETLNYFDFEENASVQISCSKSLKVEDLKNLEYIDKCLPTKSINWELKNFQWENTFRNSQKNQIILYSNNLIDYNFEIQFVDDVKEQEIKIMEEVMGLELELAYIEYD